MEVDQAKATQAGRVSVHKGETLYFCSDQRKKSFDATPAQYGPAMPPVARPAARLASRVAPVPAPGPVPHDHAADPIPDRIKQAEDGLNTTMAAAGGRSIFATNPACGAAVETTAPDALKSVFRGNTYYFLSGDCKAEFDRAPEKYAKK